MTYPSIPDNEWGNNKRKVLSSLFDNSALTLPDLAKEVALSVPTVTKIVHELLGENIVMVGQKSDSRAGRKPVSYELNPTAGYFLGIELKNGNLSIGFANLKGELVAQNYDLRYDVGQDEMETIHYVARCVDTLAHEAGIEKHDVFNACVCVSGRVNSRLGKSYIHFNVSDRPLADVFTDVLGITTIVENDTRAMTYAEYMLQPSSGDDNLLFVNLGWGLGLGIIIDGQLYGGKSGFAGEWGHLTAFDNEIMCHCGKKGCLETEVSGRALQREIIAQVKEGKSSVLTDLLQHKDDLTINEMLQAIKAGDILAIELLEQLGVKLGKNLAGMINVFNPDTVIIGGPLSKANYYLLPAIRQAVNKYSLPLVHRDTNITGAQLDSRAGVAGACMLGRKALL